MSLADAMSAPRFHHQALPDTVRYERGGFGPALQDSLRAMGHGLAVYPSPGLVIAIKRGGAGWEGMVDPRSSGKAAGY
jgi:gamma-glutamyltranspeptidase/glutathione hydrolase